MLTMSSHNLEANFWLIFFGLEGVIIICCNILGLVIFAKKVRHSRPCLLLVNQCLADCLVGIVVVVHSYMRYSRFMGITSYRLMFGTTDNVQSGKRGIILTFQVLWVLAMEETLVSLALIALERIYAVFKPFQHRTLRRKTYYQAIMATWAMTALHSLFYVYHSFYQMSNELTHLSVVIEVIMVAGSFSVLIISYLSIYVKLRFFPIFQNRVQTGNEFKLCKVLFYASIASVMTFLPSGAVQSYIKMKCEKSIPCLPENYNNISEAFVFFNSFVNFFIYMWRFPGFSESAKKMLCCHKDEHNRVQNSR